MRVYPQWLDDMGVMAKSPDMGGQTLVQHTLEVIERLVDQRRLHPAWDDNLFWARMFWGCLLHDFGKAADGFQDVLRGEKDNGHRINIVMKCYHWGLSIGYSPKDTPTVLSSSG